MKQHALLSPSSAERWLTCLPSARLEEKFPDTSGDAAKEGTVAHRLGELFIRQKLNIVSDVGYEVVLKDIQKSEYYDHAMDDHAENYAMFVMERYAEAQVRNSDAMIFLERKLDLTEYVKEGFGTGDAGIIADSILDVIDLKYGKGVPVSAENNKQMMVYALGWLLEFEHLYDIKTVRLTIYQPRIDNYSSWELPVTDLKEWAEKELKPLAALAFEGKGDFKPGSHCRFCRAKATCKANANYNLELAQHEFAEPVLLSDEEVADILNRADAFSNWIKSVEDHALAEAVNKNKKWPGYKLVEGRSNRVYSDETKVVEVLTGKGYGEEIIYKKKLTGITDLTKALGKTSFAALIEPLLIKPSGKPTLVPVTDKRPEISSLEQAQSDFAEDLKMDAA